MSEPLCDVAECDREQYAHGLCNAHWKRWWRHGEGFDRSPVRPPVPKVEAGLPRQWLEQAVRTETDSCIEWPYACDVTNGYAILRWEGRSERAYRVAWLMAGHARLPRGLEIRHLCGNAKCVNIRHLASGTSKENHADKIAHGTTNRGERQGGHKLTTEDVLAIRASNERQRDLAERYGVAQSTISLARTGVNWAHIPKEHAHG